MITSPARKIPMVLLATFVTVIVLVTLGAVWYKQTAGTTYIPEKASDFTNTQQQVLPAAQLKLIPAESTESGRKYRLVIDGLTDVLNGVAIEIADPKGGSEILSSSLEFNSELKQAGWSVAFNNQASSETGKTLSFSVLRLQPTETEQTTLELGSIDIKLGTDLLEDDITLNEEVSVVSYITGQTAKLKLQVESDMVN